MAEISTKPYLIRALYEWCADNGYRPYIAVAVDERTVVPREFVRNDEIVLNISAVATNRLTIGNDLLEFEARFGGVARQVSIPVENISAIFAQENGHGMAFEVHRAPGGDAPPSPEAVAAGAAAPAEAPAGPSPARARRRPKLASVASRDAAPARPSRRKAPIAAVPSSPVREPEPSPEDTAAHATSASLPPGQRPAGDTAPGPRAPATPATPPDGDEPAPPTPPGRPHLKRVK